MRAPHGFIPDSFRRNDDAVPATTARKIAADLLLAAAIIDASTALLELQTAVSS